MGKYTAQIAAAEAAKRPNKYAAQIAAASSGQKTSPWQVVGDTGAAMSQGALSGAFQGTGLPTMVRLGTHSYPLDSDGIANLFGDAGSAAGMAALVATVGPVNAMKIGTAFGAAGGALEASPLGQGLHKMAGEAINTNAGFPASNLPSKVLGIEGLGTAANMATRIPGAVAATSYDLVPSAALMAAGGKVGVPENARTATVKPDVQSAKLMQEYGGHATPGMLSTGKMGMAKMGDWLASKFAPGTMENINNKNTGAIERYVNEKFPEAGQHPQLIGNEIANSMDAFKNQRSREYQAAEDLVGQVQLPKGVRSGKFAQDAIAELLKSKKVSRFRRLTGNEPIDPNSVGPLRRLLQKMGNAESIQDLINQRRQWEDIEGPAFPEGMKGRGEAILQTGRGLVNDVIGKLLEFNDRLNAQGGPVSKETGLMDPTGNITKSGPRGPVRAVKPVWDAANLKYNKTQPLMNDIYSVIGEKNTKTGMRNTLISPENFSNGIITKMGGAERVAQLKEILGENFKPFEKAAVQELLQRHPQSGNYNLAGMNRLLNGKYKANGLLSPEVAQQIQDVAGMLERSGISGDAAMNPSKSAGSSLGVAPIVEAASGLTSGLTAALTGHPGAGAAMAATGLTLPLVQNIGARGWLNQVPKGMGFKIPTLESTPLQRGLAGAAVGSPWKVALDSIKGSSLPGGQ